MRSTLLFCFFLLLCAAPALAQPKYEFRGVWIATVDNIDWPKKNAAGSAGQKADFIRQLELHKANGMNAVVVQVRPAADAFYPSLFEPWSQWLTGTQGQPPSPYYDPLAFMIEEAHKRGMEFHAWLNPYRANFNINTASIAPNHITRIHPEWFLTYGDKKYFDPANKDAQQFVVTVVQDIVKRYDVDGIHMDDYFYPYRIAGKEFPDAASYSRSGSALSKDDWRRSNVDSIIRKLYTAIKKEKPLCKFGISPFGVWRNKDRDPEGSDSRAGVTNYDDLYADILLWLRKGWIDYVAPQLYLEIGHDRIAYEKLLDWWSKHSYGRHVYIGHGIYRVDENSAAWKNRNQLPDQIRLLRRYPNVQGSIYFSSKSFDRNPNGWNDSLRNNYYRQPALIPPMAWMQSKPVAATAPAIAAARPANPDSIYISVRNDRNAGTSYSLTAYSKTGTEGIRSLIVYVSASIADLKQRSGGIQKFTVAGTANGNTIEYPGFNPASYLRHSPRYFIAVSFLDHQGQETALSNIIIVTKENNGSYSFR
ncbi:MAG: family 10 glycosylhydrolase [Chitinophagaceae bacterium]